MLSIHHFKRPTLLKQGLQVAVQSLKTQYTSSCCASKKKQEEKPSMASLKFWSDPITWQRTRVNTLRYNDEVFSLAVVYVYIYADIRT